MKPYILSETNWKTVKSTDYQLAVLPWGATEAHNYHLPYATDNYEAQAIAEGAAKVAWEKGAKVIVLPYIPFGVNTGQINIKLDVNLNPSTQLAILDDIISTLNVQGIKRFVILNSHGGNDFKQMLRELGLKYPEMSLSMVNWDKIEEQKSIFYDLGEHAGEIETSLMMYLRPDLVLPLEEAGDGAHKRFRFEGIQEGWAWAERKWDQVTKDTGIGNPTKSSMEKGKRFFDLVCEKIGSFLFEFATTQKENFYE